jgi:hypothetical protein
MPPADDGIDPDVIALRDGDPAALRAGLRRLAAEAAADHPGLDEDRLLSVAVKLARSRRSEVAGTVVEWLAEDPSPARMDAAAVLLRGIWKPREGAAPLDPRHVEALMNAGDAMPAGDEAADASFVLALATAVQAIPEDPVRARAIRVLREASERRWRHPGVQPTLARVL